MFLDLTLATSDNVFTRALVNGDVEVAGINVHGYRIHPAEIFLRQLRYSEFDISEMSLASFIRSMDVGERRWIAIPVFPTRTLFHTWMIIRNGSDIHEPEDLRGKRVGIPEYPITGAVWTRGVLKDEFGVSPEEIEWVVERSTTQSHGGASAFTAPPDVTLTPVPTGSSLADLIQRGEIDALAVPIPGQSKLDASSGWGDTATTEGIVRPLFKDVNEERRRYKDATGLVHINHTVVIRREIIDEHPWVAQNLYGAFQEAKDSAISHGRDFINALNSAGSLSHVIDITALDPVPYGIEENEQLLETLLRYLAEQHLTSGRVDLEDLFAPVNL